MGQPNNLPCPAIKRWEEFSISLVTSTKDYMNHCFNLGTESLCQGAKAEDLAARIDANVENAHAAISRQLTESRAALLRTRNKLVSPFSRFPKEVASEIFLNVVYDYSNEKAPEPLSADEEVKLIYHHLCKLLGVCSAWRELMVSTGLLWLVIPLVETSSGKQLPFELALERAGRTKQHLAGIINTRSPALRDTLLEVLEKHGDRFYHINLSAVEVQVIEQATRRLLQHDVPLSLSKLSIRTNDHAVHRMAVDSDHITYLFHPDSLDTAAFAKLVGTLSALCICGTYIHWNTITFSSQLVDLCISNIALGDDSALHQLLYALNSAAGLRDLKIISLYTSRDPETTFDPKRFPMVTLPNLQSLHLQGLYVNTLEVVLSKIAPGSHRLTLYLGSKSLRTNLRGIQQQNDPNLVDISPLRAILKPIHVDTLMLSTHWEGAWLSGSMFRTLFRAMPTLKTLKMDGWIFDKHDSWSLKHLARSKDAPEDPEDSLPPALENLHFSNAVIYDLETFRELVSSHPLQRVVLGGRRAMAFLNVNIQFQPLQENSEPIQWLRGKIPDVRLVSFRHRLLEFYEGQWRLW
ncbi:hypothetical protein B0J17DRAFT_680673 [Rhizoctonia solani]|nr:hypothetical protein B0J17DRAFT_680673 [Rhizoctonia solani]